MLTVAETFPRVWATVRPLPPRAVTLATAAGRVLREPVVADRPFPPFDRVTMDGLALAYAAVAAGQTVFRVERTQLAGQQPKPLRDPAAAIEIMTGAALPPGTDTVVRYEDLDLVRHPDGQCTATLRVPPPVAGHNVHPRGSDCPAGTVLLRPGTLLGAPEIAIAATVGATTLGVSARPRVAVVSTGDELVPVGRAPKPHQVRRSNALLLAVAAREAGAVARVFHLPDHPATLHARLPPLLAGFDAVLLSGGVSQGKADFLPGALRAAGVEELAHQVSQRPGKPLWFGRYPGGAVVFGLPGNPVSTFVTYHRYVAPWLRGVQQPAALALPAAPAYATLAAPVSFAPALTYFLLVRLEAGPDGRLLAHPVFPNSSGDMTSLPAADGFLELPADRNAFAAGSTWPLWRFAA